MNGGLEEKNTFEMLEVFSDKLKKCIRYLVAPSLSEMGLKSYHMLFLLPIERNGGMSQKDIRELVPYDKSRVSMVVGELIAMDLVINEGTGKTSSLRLTEKGEEACRLFRSKVKNLNSEIMGVLDEKDHQEFIHCLMLVNDRIDELLAQHDVGSGPFAEEVHKENHLLD